MDYNIIILTILSFYYLLLYKHKVVGMFWSNWPAKKIQCVEINKIRISFFSPSEWTGTLLKFLKDQIPKLQEYYTQIEKPPNPNATLNSVHTSETEQKLAIRHWNYCIRLLKYMYEEGKNCVFILKNY